MLPASPGFVPSWHLWKRLHIVLHPPWYTPYQKNGPGGKRGCKKAHEKCAYFHPPLCQTALQAGVCKEVHILGTATSKQALARKKKQQSDDDSKKKYEYKGKRNRIPSKGPSKPEHKQDGPFLYDKGEKGSRSRTNSSSSAASAKGNDQYRQRSVSFSKSQDSQSNEDFYKQLSQMKADMQ